MFIAAVTSCFMKQPFLSSIFVVNLGAAVYDRPVQDAANRAGGQLQPCAPADGRMLQLYAQ